MSQQGAQAPDCLPFWKSPRRSPGAGFSFPSASDLSAVFFLPIPTARTYDPGRMSSQFLPVFVQILVAIGFAAVSLGASVLLGKSARTNATKDSAYECGMVPIGEGAPRFSVKFYLVAMLFVIFDIEVVFMYPWAVQFRDLIRESAVPLASMAGFAGVLAIAYVYALKKGALTWKN